MKNEKEQWITDIEIDEIKLPVTFYLNTGKTIVKEVRSRDLSDRTMDSIFKDLSKYKLKSFRREWHAHGRIYGTACTDVEIKPTSKMLGSLKNKEE